MFICDKSPAFRWGFFVTKNTASRYLTMKVIDPNNTTHSFYLIGRDNQDITALTIYNESTGQTETPAVTSLTNDGYTQITFDLVTKEDSKYQFTLFADTDIVYRGKIWATSQDTQEYKQTNDYYEYR